MSKKNIFLNSVTKADVLCTEITDRTSQLKGLMESASYEVEADEVFQVISRELGRSVAQELWNDMDWDNVEWKDEENG